MYNSEDLTWNPASIFWNFSKNHENDRCIFDEESKTGLGFEIEHRQQKWSHKPTLQSIANQDVEEGYVWQKTHMHSHKLLAITVFMS